MPAAQMVMGIRSEKWGHLKYSVGMQSINLRINSIFTIFVFKKRKTYLLQKTSRLQ